MRKCVIGNGYIGSAFKAAGYDCITREMFDFDRRPFDTLEYHLRTNDVIVNCIGKTDTKWSEIPDNFQTLFKTNAEFVRLLSDFCRKHDKKLIHISTGDLYGNQFIKNNTFETVKNLNIGSEYRFSKLCGEKFCNPDDLILRIRLPFDNRNHPKNLIVKSLNYKKFYSHANSFSYVPDIINAANVLLDKNQSGIFNVVQPENRSLLQLIKLYSQDQDIMALQENMVCGAINHSLDNIHIHNTLNISKLLNWVDRMLPLEEAWIKSYNELMLTMKTDMV